MFQPISSIRKKFPFIGKNLFPWLKVYTYLKEMCNIYKIMCNIWILDKDRKNNVLIYPLSTEAPIACCKAASILIDIPQNLQSISYKSALINWRAGDSKETTFTLKTVYPVFSSPFEVREKRLFHLFLNKPTLTDSLVTDHGHFFPQWHLSPQAHKEIF